MRFAGCARVGELREMIAVLTRDAQETAAFNELDTCSHGLTCANSSVAHAAEAYDCGSFDLVAAPDTVPCGQSCSATECCILHVGGSTTLDASEVEARMQAQLILDNYVLAATPDCVSPDEQAMEQCEAAPIAMPSCRHNCLNTKWLCYAIVQASCEI